MAKSQKNQTFVLKIGTGYLSKHDWNLSLNLRDVRKCAEFVVSLGSSQVLRWLEEMNNSTGNDVKATEIKKNIKILKKLPDNLENKQRICDLYDELYDLQFQRDYIMLVIDKVKDYKYACKNGFTISVKCGDKNEKIKYKRFLGTAGSIKKNTIIFVNEKKYDELYKRINNGRYVGPKEDEEPKKYNGMGLNYKFIPAKINAYFALQCSASISVTWPRIIVVNDAITKFKTNVRIVKNSGNEENPDWPDVSDDIETEIENNVSDGMGFITPEMSKIWAEELGEGTEPLSGFNTRCAFLKGMVFTIPFKEFAEEVAHNYFIPDAWGDLRDVREADVILTTSMLKLWNSYAGFEDYYKNCMENHYEFCIAKTSPRELRNIHTTNYQYLQDFILSDDQINELIAPTVDNIKECLGLDWKKLILYMCGTALDEKNVETADVVCKSIMVNHDLVKDPYVRNKVSRMIKKRIKDAKIGVLDVSGDYAIVGNDPYSLLQSIFGMKITGLLKAGECFHRYWHDKGSDEIVVFRAPMTTHENVCKLKVVTSEKMEKWYRYNKTCCFINSWDTTPIRLNGCDYDSDTVFSTDNKVLLESYQYKTTLMCLQQSSVKTVPTEKDYISSDINGFGDSIGSVTNKATNMISLRENFDKDSEEYKKLTYRISTMMNYQQNAIDRIKGIVARPIPKEWLNGRLFKINDDDSDDVVKKKIVNQNIAADVRPWFFIYRYSSLMSEYLKYEKSVRSNCKIRFRKTLDELYASSNPTQEEKDFLFYYEKYMPVNRSPGTMNRICWRIEDEFDSLDVLPDEEFDYSILKSDEQYSNDEYQNINNLYNEYNSLMQLYLKGTNKNDSKKDDRTLFKNDLVDNFRRACSMICPNTKVLTNILIDVCYSSESSKAFAWELVGDEIYKNLLNNCGNVIEYPSRDDEGDISFMGKKFSLCKKNIEE